MCGHPFVRAATPDDVTAIEHIVRESYAAYIPRIGRPPAPMTVDYGAAVAHTDHVHVLLDAGIVVGLLIIVAEPDHVFIENVAVAAAHQGRGYGRLLLGHAENSARAGGLALVRLYTNAAMTENLAMYRRHGYREVSRRCEDGFDRVYFEKSLA